MHKIQVVCLLAVVLRVEVKLWKHLDPTQVSDLTLEPWFVRLTIKKKVFQLRFLEEVLCDRYSMKGQKSFLFGHFLQIDTMIQYELGITLWSLISVPLGIRVPHPRIFNYSNSTAGIKSTAIQKTIAGTIAVLFGTFA